MRKAEIIMLVMMLLITLLILVWVSHPRLKYVVRVEEIDAPLIARAFRYHGITEALIDSSGTIYFIRNEKWCSLFSIGFREMLAQEKAKEREDR